MKRAAAALMVLATGCSTGAAGPGPDAAALGAALAAPGGPAPAVKDVRCTPIPEDSSEFRCTWRQQAGGQWTPMQAMVGRDGARWLLLDAPGG